MPHNKEYGLKKFVPGVGKQMWVQADEIAPKAVTSGALDFITEEGSQTATAVAAGATVTITISHTAFNLNTVPVVSTATASASVVLGEIRADSFDVDVTNSSTASQDVVVDYKRVGI